VRLTELLAREGAPWRPFEDQGILVTAQKKPRDAKAIFAACERPLLTHLKAVCDWPERERNQSWRVGDYSFYILEFSPAPKTDVYLQFWSEPDTDGVIFEISSGAMNPPTDRYVNSERKERLRDHGFEIGGNAGNFSKTVTVDSAREARAVARETIALACHALGYDGTQDLRYRLYLGTTTKLKHVFDKIEPAELLALLKEWGFPAKRKPNEVDKPPLIECRTDSGPFGVLLMDETKPKSGAYQAVVLRTFRSLPAADDDADETTTMALELANQVNRAFSALQASVDSDGDLLLESSILLHGGVTPEHLKARFEMWRRMVRVIGEQMTQG
jgi:hypothetical protein